MEASREAWNELIEKYPTWLLHFCATLSKRLAHVEQQYSQGRDAFNSLAEEFYGSRSPEQQQFSRRASLLTTIDPQTADRLLQTEGAGSFVADLEKSEFPLIRSLETNRYELHAFLETFEGKAPSDRRQRNRAAAACSDCSAIRGAR